MTRISALTLEIVAWRRSILGAVPYGPVKDPPTRLASGGRPQRLRSPPRCSPGIRRSGDLAAQVFRTELFQRGGLAIWNGSWYGGHYTLTYSVLFPPLAALLGPQVVGMLAVVASSYFFDRLVRDRWGDAARWATLWFAAGVVTLLADGQLTFALGVAFGLGSLRALQVGRGPLGRRRRGLRPLQPGRRRLPRRRRRGRRARARPAAEPGRGLGRRGRPRPRPDPQPRLPRARPVPVQPSPPSSRSRSGAARRSS